MVGWEKLLLGKIHGILILEKEFLIPASRESSEAFPEAGEAPGEQEFGKMEFPENPWNVPGGIWDQGWDGRSLPARIPGFWGFLGMFPLTCRDPGSVSGASPRPLRSSCNSRNSRGWDGIPGGKKPRLKEEREKIGKRRGEKMGINLQE